MLLRPYIVPLFLACALSLGGLFLQVGSPFPTKAASPLLDLSAGWEYAPEEVFSRTPEGMPKAPSIGWKAFDSNAHVKGTYWLRKTFNLRYPFRQPALAFGITSNLKKTYINGELVGETRPGENQTFFAFNPNLLKLDGTDTVLIEARPPNLSIFSGEHGLNIGTYMGDFDEVRYQVSHRQVQYHAARGVCFSLAIAILVGVFGVSLFRRFHETRAELVMNLVQLIHRSMDVNQTVSDIQKRVCQFLKVQRSSLYLIETSNSGEPVFKASYVLGSNKTQGKITPEIKADEGILGTIVRDPRPLLIEDISKDPRFGKKIGETYQSRSCMIFPLLAGTRLIGVLTFADKSDMTAFTPQDFAIAKEVCSDLVLLLDNKKFQDTLGDGFRRAT